MGILTIEVPLGKAQKRTYVTPALGAALRLPRVHMIFVLSLIETSNDFQYFEIHFRF